ncbi:hypothetical protein DA717_13665 [Piscirickettsiaceae bacterium NZ-RLO2]|nr:hypothetical protein DA717_13665 [Piscirickettsiaceae bacterium NZ-RLO2]
MNIDDTQLEEKINNFCKEIDPNHEEKYRSYREGLSLTLTELKKVTQTQLTALYLRHYLDPNKFSDPVLSIPQFQHAFLAQLKAMFSAKEGEHNGPKLLAEIALIMKSELVPQFQEVINDFHKTYYWLDLKRLELSQEYVEKVFSNPSCFRKAVDLKFNKFCIEKVLDNPEFFKEALEKNLTLNKFRSLLNDPSNSQNQRASHLLFDSPYYLEDEPDLLEVKSISQAHSAAANDGAGAACLLFSNKSLEDEPDLLEVKSISQAHSAAANDGAGAACLLFSNKSLEDEPDLLEVKSISQAHSAAANPGASGIR